jgi:Protein of unknown function (DUF3237)
VRASFRPNRPPDWPQITGLVNGHSVVDDHTSSGLSVLLLLRGIDTVSFRIYRKTVYRMLDLEILEFPVVLRIILMTNGRGVRLLPKVLEDMDFNKKQFKSKLPIRLLAAGGQFSIPNMGEALQPYFAATKSVVIPDSGHFVPEEQRSRGLGWIFYERRTCMSIPLVQALPETLKSVKMRPLFVLHERVRPLLVVGETPNAFRRIGVIQGAPFEGERLSGEVVGGNDWQAVRTDSCYQTGRSPRAENNGWQIDRDDVPLLAGWEHH